VTLPAPAAPGALSTLLGALRRAGWHDTTPDDPYTLAAQALWLEPIRHKGARGHTPARLLVIGTALGLSTYTADGTATEQVSWGWIDPGNLERARAYITEATEAAAEERMPR
jgi:hypothetical protein